MKIKVFAAIGFLVCAGAAFAAQSNLYETFSRKNEVAVYLANFTDSSGQNKVDPADLRAKLAGALADRKSIRFKIVPDKTQAELTIDADVKGFVWMKEDPVDMIMGAGGTAMDALIKENYASMEAVFRVADAKTGALLWSDKVRATVTKKDIPEKDSPPLVNEDMAKVFIRECFGKKHSGR